jgi:hypothetical protein
MCVTLFGQDASEKFEKPIDPGGTLSNRVLVAKMPRRPMPEYITPDQVRALTWQGGETVKNACLSCPEPDTELFPADARIVFLNCNLDNVLIPAGCKLVDCLHKPQEQKRFIACEVSVAGKTEVRDVLLVKGSKTETTGKTVDGESVTVTKIKESVK